MKKILTPILSLFILTACTSTNIKRRGSELVKELEGVISSEEEAKILDEIWGIWYTNPDQVSLSVSVIDAEDRQVVNDLSTAIEPVLTTINLHGPNWDEKIEFTPLDINNVYLLLRE